jgi:hypothetical protein
MIVCNRTGRDDESRMVDSESIIVDHGEKLLTLRSPDSTVFVVDCVISDGHIASGELAASVGLTSRSRVRAPR